MELLIFIYSKEKVPILFLHKMNNHGKVSGSKRAPFPFSTEYSLRFSLTSPSTFIISVDFRIKKSLRIYINLKAPFRLFRSNEQWRGVRIKTPQCPALIHHNKH